MKGLYAILTWAMRLLVGATFIFSGFVKAIDPWGTLYKFEDYMGAMHLPVFRNILLVGVFALCAYEFTIGVFLMLGCFRRSAPILAAAMMAVMLPLTLWIAIADPVADCGCFGDALVISNWATFWKNVVLVLAIVWLIKFNTRRRCLITPSLQWIALLASVVFTVCIGFAGYVYQPLIDFRPYPVGTTLIDHSDDNSQESDDNMLFVYERDGVEKSFSIDDELPDESEGWTFVRRESAPSRPSATKSATTDAKNDSERNFRIWDENGDEDISESVVPDDGKQLIILMPDLKNVSMATTWNINSLYTWATANGIDMIGVVAGTRDDIENWKDISLAAYPLYTADDTAIKMVARGNPAVIYLEDGKIRWKSTLRALDTEDFQKAGTKTDPKQFARDNRTLLRNVAGLYLLIMAVLVLLSFIPDLRRCFPSVTRKKAKTTEDETQS